MKTARKIISLLVLLVLVFYIGWEAGRYLVLRQVGIEDLTEEPFPSVGAISSLIVPVESRASMNTFWQVWGLLEDSYVDGEVLDNQAMVYGAIKGMVNSLDDPYTEYMDPAETKEFEQSLNGELEGIGAELTIKNQALVVVTPVKNSPAEKAGLQSGDIIFMVDGEIVADMTLFQAVMSIRGEKGTSVTLTIIREGVDEPFEVSIVRDTVNIESVSIEDKGDGIFYVSINQFNDNTKPEFDSAVDKLVSGDAEGVIIDLRNNGGGYLETAVDIASHFVKGTGPVVTIKRKDSADDETFYLNGRPILPEIPIVVLINEGSASASEIVAAALRDYDRAIVMGEKSFGKGSVQEVDMLDDGSSLRMTIAKWYTPNDENIDEIGLEPDIKVEYTDDHFKAGIDPQLDAAVDYLKKL
jgi:carboxyl-terminal processing protease